MKFNPVNPGINRRS